MRKISFLLISIIVCFSAFVIPHRKHHLNKSAAEAVFAEVVAQKIELANIILKNFSGPDEVIELKKKVEALKQSRLSDEEMWIKANSLLKLPPGVNLKDYDKNFRSHWKILNQQYGKALTPQFVQQKTGEVYQTLSRNGEMSVDCVDKVGYTVCSAGVTAAAIVGHASCVGTLFGAPFCFLLVATIQVAAIQDCYKTYCK